MPAPKGNQFALGCDTNGKPRKFKSPQQLQMFIDEYYKYEDSRPIAIYHSQLDKATGQPVKMEVQRPYTIEGLALWLGVTRQTLLNYQKKEGYEDYFNIITHAKETIRQSQIQCALVGGTKEKFTEFLLINNADYHHTTKYIHDFENKDISINVESQEAADETEKLKKRLNGK